MCQNGKMVSFNILAVVDGVCVHLLYVCQLVHDTQSSWSSDEPRLCVYGSAEAAY